MTTMGRIISYIQARAKSITLRCDKTAAVPIVKANPYRIHEVLSNLLDNAVKFTPEGGTIIVNCQAEADHVRFEVTDTGRGIEEQHLGKIFDIF